MAVSFAIVVIKLWYIRKEGRKGRRNRWRKGRGKEGTKGGR
jgi:hypothetical protein